MAARYHPLLGGLGVVESPAANRKMHGLEVDVLTSLDEQPRTDGWRTRQRGTAQIDNEEQS